jgi:hypothetical protein
MTALASTIWRCAAAGFVVGALLASGTRAWRTLTGSARPSRPVAAPVAASKAVPRGSRIVARPLRTRSSASIAVREAPPSQRSANLDPDARDPALRAAHLRLLTAEPFLQRLPYRDRWLGVALAGVNGQGKPVLVVVYRGAAATARRDLRAVLQRDRDPGTAYELRYRALGR